MPIGEIIAEIACGIIEVVAENRPKAGCFLVILALVIIGLLIWVL
jgi:hypothetical protein